MQVHLPVQKAPRTAVWTVDGRGGGRLGEWSRPHTGLVAALDQWLAGAWVTQSASGDTGNQQMGRHRDGKEKGAEKWVVSTLGPSKNHGDASPHSPTTLSSFCGQGLECCPWCPGHCLAAVRHLVQAGCELGSYPSARSLKSPHE